MSDRPNTPPADELAQVRHAMKALEEREAALRSLLLSDPSARTGNAWVAEVRTVTQERTDIKELRACHPAIVSEFTFPAEVKRIVLSAIDQDTGEIVSARKMQKEQAA